MAVNEMQRFLSGVRNLPSAGKAVQKVLKQKCKVPYGIPFALYLGVGRKADGQDKAQAVQDVRVRSRSPQKGVRNASDKTFKRNIILVSITARYN